MCRKSGSEIEPRDEVAVETYRLTLEGWAGRSAALGRCASQSAAIILDIPKMPPFEGGEGTPTRFRRAGVRPGSPRLAPERYLMLAVTWAGL